MADADLGASPPDAALPEIGVELMSQNFRNRALASVAAVAIVASGAVGAALYEGQPALAETAKAPITVNAQAPATFADVVDQVKPAVVSVRVKVENAMSDGDGSPSLIAFSTLTRTETTAGFTWSTTSAKVAGAWAFTVIGALAVSASAGCPS